jgi:hypothetical protein
MNENQQDRREPAEPADVISSGPRTVSSRVAWLTVVVLLAAALAGAIIAAVHYHAEASAARQESPSPQPGPPRPVRLILTSGTTTLPPSGMLTGEVTVFAVRSSASRAQVIVTARISGGRPRAQYELFGGDCAGNAPDHPWAVAVTNARGSASFAGRAWTVSVSHEYYLIVGTPGLYREHPGPAVRGQFGIPRGLSPVRHGVAPCPATSARCPARRGCRQPAPPGSSLYVQMRPS